MMSNRTTTASIPCPDCGEPVERQLRLIQKTPGWDLEMMPAEGFSPGKRRHVCKPKFPEEPLEFGTVVYVVNHRGMREAWVRTRSGLSGCSVWRGASSMGEFDWDQLNSFGEVIVPQDKS